MSTTLRFVDAEGFTWQVCEIQAKPADLIGAGDASGGGWLYFLSRRDTLRLSHYPAAWWCCSSAELEALRRRAQAPRAPAVPVRERRAERELRSDAR